MWTFLFGATMLALACAACAGGWNVVESGAKGDGVTDDTAVFQKALDEAGKAGGGVVDVPAGRYRIDGNLVIPGAVTLQGVFRTPPTAGDKMEDLDGSVLYAYAGRGSEEGEPFIRLGGNAAVVSGLVIAYPEWKRSDVPPVPYPACIASENTEDVSVLNCLLLNPYEGIKLVRAHRHIVRNVFGYPIKRGIYVDQCYDIGRIENIHYWPFGVTYRPNDPYSKWINTEGVAFEFARTDWQYVTNTFCFGYGVGYKFSETESGSCNGNFLGIGADSCERAVLVEQSQAPGLLITNGEFVGRWGSTDAVCLEITEKNRGKVSLSNCSFWGPIDRCVVMKSPAGQFSALGCNFVDWDTTGSESPAIQIDAGKAIVQGCTFGNGTLHVRVGENVRSAIIMGNQASDGLVVDNKAGKRTQILGNEMNPVEWTEEARANYRILIGQPGDQRYVKKWYGRETTHRWSRPESLLVLPVLPDKEYSLSVDVFVPPTARSPEAGLYLGDKRIAELPKGDSGALRATLPPSNSGSVSLSIRVKGWVPREVEPGSSDDRVLGIQIHSVTMQAKGAKGKVFDGNSGEWVE